MHGNEASVFQLCIKFYNCVWGKGRLGLGVGGSHAVSICLAWHIRDKLAKAFKTTFLMLKKLLTTYHLCLLLYTRGGPTASMLKSTPIPLLKSLATYGSVCRDLLALKHYAENH